MSSIENKVQKGHLLYLDSARGIAAMMVLLGHYVYWRHPDHLIPELLCFVFNANEAVSFFFVLSGFVLSYKYIVLGGTLDVGKYFIARCMRLFPGFIIAVTLNVLYNFRHELNLQTILDIFVYGKHEFWEEVYLFKSRMKYFIPGWTLSIEMNISLFMPFAIALAKINKKSINWLLLTFILIASVSQFYIHFMLGLIIACYFNEIKDPSFKNTRWYKYRYLLILIACVLFSVRQIDRLSHLGSTFIYFMNYTQYEYGFFGGLAAFVFLAAIIQSPKAQKILNHKILVFYGRISYGIYLMHWLVVCVIFDNWDRMVKYFPNEKTAFVPVMLICVAISTLLATILHYTIELPFIDLGRKISSRLKKKYVII